MTITDAVVGFESPNTFYSPYSRELFNVSENFRIPLSPEAENAFIEFGIRPLVLESISVRDGIRNEYNAFYPEDELEFNVLPREYSSSLVASILEVECVPVPEPSLLVLFSLVGFSIARKLKLSGQ